MMQLAEDWRAVLRHAWSVRFGILAALLGGCSAVFAIDPFILPLPLGAAAIIAGVTSAAASLAGIAATFSRIVSQKDLPGEARAPTRDGRPQGDFQ